MQSVAMMQSVALGESTQYPNGSESVDDFVLVQQPSSGNTSFDLMEEIEDDAGSDDDDSYDYCDDVYSIVSNNDGDPQCVSICSDAVGERHEKLDPQQVILTVPSILLKDLDDAHEAAKLVRIPDSEQRSDDSTITLARSAATKETAVEVDSREHVAVTDNKSSDKLEMTEGLDKKNLQDEKEVDLTTTEGNLSRASNKKRRKKLKLMKKAIAAANATQALSERACAAARSPDNQAQSKLAKKSKKKSRTTGGRNTKRVANIAVACATETLSAYRKELTSKGIHHYG